MSDTLAWRKSSFCRDGGCVEAAPYSDGQIALRDSKNPAADIQVYNTTEWDAFLRGVKAGEFDYLLAVS